MSVTQGLIGPSGRLTALHVTAEEKAVLGKVGLGWKMRNFPNLWRGTWRAWTAKVFSRLTQIPTITAELRAIHTDALGRRTDYGVVGRLVVTDAGVAFLVDDWDDDTTDITTMNFHASGTGSVAEDQTDTALGAESTTITDRVAGTKSQPSANVLQSVGTQNYTGVGAIVEHGLFSIITESAGTLWDRTVFSVINVGNGDSIQWTYQGTINAGS